MKKCKQCRVKVSTTRKTCPLCGNFLEIINDGPVLTTYPSHQPLVQKRNLFLRILAFILIVSSLISLLINLIYNKDNLWSFYIIGGSIYLWILFKSTILSKTPIAKKLIIQMIVISLVVALIDYVSDKKLINGWSVSYVIPVLSFVTTVANIIVIMIKRMKYSDYILYFLGTIFLGFVPMILYLLKVTNILWPSLSAACLSLVTIIGMIVFGDRQTKDEIKKRFHI